MDWETGDQLVKDTTEGVPGAIKAVIRLQLLDNWRQILEWLVAKKYTGRRLQKLFEEDCNHCVNTLSQWIDDKIFYDMRKAADRVTVNKYETF